MDRFFDEFHRGESLLILTHDHPDPDCISSAAALKEIATALGSAKTTIAYGGIIGRSENAHMVKYLKMKLKPIDRVRVSDFSKVALVDTQPRTGNNALPLKRIPDLVIDHHPMIAPTRQVPFADIRTGYGATASILTEYLFHFGLDIDQNLATALLYGIKSETQDLGREAEKVDMESYTKLFPIANKRLLAKIINSRVPVSYFRWLQDAIQNAQLVGNTIVTRVGSVGNPDMIPEIADLMLRADGIAWVLCIGHYREGIYLSIRTTNTRKDAGKMMKIMMREKGSGGGHGLMAGGKIPAPDLEPWQIHEIEDQVENHFLRLLHKENIQRLPLLSDAEDRRRGKPRVALVR